MDEYFSLDAWLAKVMSKVHLNYYTETDEYEAELAGSKMQKCLAPTPEMALEEFRVNLYAWASMELERNGTLPAI